MYNPLLRPLAAASSRRQNHQPNTTQSQLCLFTASSSQFRLPTAALSQFTTPSSPLITPSSRLITLSSPLTASSSRLTASSSHSRSSAITSSRLPSHIASSPHLSSPGTSPTVPSSRRRLLTLLLLPLFLLSSCVKVLDYVKDHPKELANCCKVDVVNTQIIGLAPQQFKFSYNTAGLPTLIAAQIPTGYQNNDFHFRYDSHGRVHDYLMTDAGLTYVYLWHRYTYPSPGAIIDSFYDYQGDLSNLNPPDPSELESVTRISLDFKGRASRLISTVGGTNPPAYDTTYIHYDANGDAISAGIHYDDSINPYQLSTVWQTVFNTYSLHNPYVPASADGTLPAAIPSYNQLGLPLEFVARIPGQQGMGTNFGLYYTYMYISYTCDTSAIAGAGITVPPGR